MATVGQHVKGKAEPSTNWKVWKCDGELILLKEICEKDCANRLKTQNNNKLQFNNDKEGWCVCACDWERKEKGFAVLSIFQLTVYPVQLSHCLLYFFIY